MFLNLTFDFAQYPSPDRADILAAQRRDKGGKRELAPT